MNPSKLGDPPPTTSNVITPLHLPLLLLPSPSLRSAQRWPIDRRPVVLWYYALHQTGEGWLPSVPGVFGFIQQRAAALYFPLFSVLYNSGRAALYRPVFGFI